MNRQQSIPWLLGVGGAGLLLILPLFIGQMTYIMHLAITAYFYAILASSWSLLAGYAGQFSFGHMAFMAIGAYTTGLIGKFIRFTSAPTQVCAEIPLGDWFMVFANPRRMGSAVPDCMAVARAETLPAGTLIIFPPVWASILMGILMGALFGLVVGALVLRLRSVYLALFTIGFSEILRAVISAEIQITQGQSGLEMVPLFPQGITLFGTYFSPASKIPPYYAMLLLLLFSLGLMAWLTSSRFGLFIRAIREDEEAAASMGVDIVRYKLLVFVLTSALAAAAGAFNGHYVGIITPNILIILQMSLVISMAVIGGLENIFAAAIGAIVLEFALESLRTSFSIGPLTIDMSMWRLVFFGLLLMVTLRWQRNGLIAPAIEFFTRRNVAAETVSIRQARERED
jgi:branched-chain amino acid transport system permease protein